MLVMINPTDSHETQRDGLDKSQIQNRRRLNYQMKTVM